MGVTGVLKKEMQVGGITINGETTIESASGLPPTIVALAAAKIGALTTRTDDDTGELTMAAGHGLVTGKIDVNWIGGARRGMDAVVDANAIAIDGGDGDNLPADETAITATAQTTVNVDFPGTALKMIGVKPTCRANVDFQLANGTSLKAYDVPAGAMVTWVEGEGETTPIDGLVGQVVVSAAEATDGNITVIGLFDSLS